MRKLQILGLQSVGLPYTVTKHSAGLPPGQAKKYGCRTYVYRGRPHYYYRDERGRIIVRRPIIEVHGGVDVH